MRTCSIITLFIGVTFASCNTGSKQSSGPPKSFELTGMADTINLIDGNGKKQGLWLMPISKDTVVYRNDTAYSVTAPSTSGEIVRGLKTGFNGTFIKYGSLVVESH
jgi:hypothetical protein